MSGCLGGEETGRGLWAECVGRTLHGQPAGNHGTRVLKHGVGWLVYLFEDRVSNIKKESLYELPCQ